MRLWKKALTAVAALSLAVPLTVVGGTATAATAATAAAPDVTWICSPNLASDLCNDTPLDNTVVAPDGSQTVTTPTVPPADQRPVDCFYLHPSVSEWTTALTDSAIGLVSQWQTANFAPTCRIFAPSYRQWGLFTPPPQGYDDVLAAWNQYLAQDNHGRGVILIGHSQGALLLRQLIETEIDHNAAERRLLVGAFLMGGNVMVRPGQTTGGDFDNVPLCTQKGQFSCVVAYSTFETIPPPWGFSAFGNASTDPLSPLYSTSGAPLVSGSGYEVACTDPGVLSGLAGPFGITVPKAPIPDSYTNLHSAYQSTLNNAAVPDVGTTWLTAYQFTGSCQVVNGANTYIYNPVGGSPEFGQPYAVGTHEIDLQLGVNRLTTIANLQTEAWLANNR